MISCFTPFSLPFRSALGAIALSTVAVAQVPPGWCAASAVKQNGATFPGNGGLYLTHPRTPMPMLAVAGLPPALTAANVPFPLPSPGLLGANCVLLHESGDLLVAPVVQPGQSVDLHRITVTGSPATGFAASAITTIHLGFGNPVAGGAGVSQMAFVTTNSVLVGGAQVSNAAGGSGPMGFPGPVQFGLVNLATGIANPVVPGPIPYPAAVPANLIAQINALTYDATTGMVTFGVWANTTGVPGLTPRTSWLCRFSLTNPTTVTLVTSMPGTVMNLAKRSFSGSTETIAAFQVGSNTLLPVMYRVPPAGPPVAILPNATVPRWDSVTALTVEPSTGELAFSGIRLAGNATTGGVHLLQMATGTVIQLGNALASGMPRGNLSGIAVAPALVPSGSPSSCPSSPSAYAWCDVPHPDKLPFVGNLNFFVDVDHAPGTTPVFELGVLSFTPLPPTPPLPQCPTLLMLVSPFSVLPARPSATGKTCFNLPLPGSLPPGFQVYLQSAHFTAGSIFASDRLEVNIL